MIERQLAQAIHSLALSPAEIEKLPDTYQLALASGAFSHRADPRQFAFLPDDLFLAGSAWVELLPGDAPLRHTRIAGGRSLFRAFVKVPADSRGTNILADYVRYSHDEDNNHAQKPVKKLPSFPVGTQFLLLREMICLDENWQMAPTHIAEAVQFRDSYRGIIRQHLFAREAELSRDLLFHGKQGGLRAVQANEEQVIFYESLGFLRVDDLGNGPNLAPFPGNCAGCHQPRVSGTFDFNPNVRIATPNRSAPMDSVVRWKVEHGKLDQLREFARSPYPDAR
jgi:hypothetical protein